MAGRRPTGGGGGGRRSSGGGGGGSIQRRPTGGSTRRDYDAPKKKKRKKRGIDWNPRHAEWNPLDRDFWRGGEEALSAPTRVIGAGLRRVPSKKTRTAANIIEALGAAGTGAALRPRATARGGKEIVTGAIESIPATKKMVETVGVKKTGKLFLEAMIKDYKKRYGNDWEAHAREDPLSNLLDVLSIAGGYARGAAFAGAAGRLGTVTNEARIAAALSKPIKTWRESSRPGLYRMVTDKETGEAKLKRGSPPGRKVRFLPPGEGKTPIEGVQSWSRSPLLRFVQEINDDVAQRFPEARVFGQRARATRAQNTTRERALKRVFAQIGGTVDVEGLSREELTRAFWGSQMGDHSAGTLRAVRAALDSESGLDLPGDDAAFSEWIREARKAGFAPGLIKRLDKAIKLAEKVPEGSPRYNRAVEALEQMTDVSEQVIQDEKGFDDIQRSIERARDYLTNATDPEKVTATQKFIDDMTEKQKVKRGEFNQMFVGRKNRLREWVWANAPVDSPERQAWVEHLAEKWGDRQKAEDAMTISDRLGRRFALKGVYESPAQWYAEKVGMPTDEGAAEFIRRMEESEGDLAAQFQEGEGFREGIRQTVMDLDEETGLKNSEVFYSPLQRFAKEKMPPEMDAAQLERLIQGNIPGSEYYNSGLADYFDEFTPGQKITREEFFEYLSHRLNAYNLVEVYRSDALHAKNTPLEAKFGPRSQWGSVVVSRKGEPGEYREIEMVLPQHGRDYDEMGDYYGKGDLHWNKANVVAHVRFHVFEEDGKRKLLIEEIQSDWRSQHYEWEQFQKHHGDIDAEDRELFKIRDDMAEQLRHLEEDLQDPDTSVDERADLHNEFMSLQDEMFQLDGQLEGVPYPTAPPPLGNRYYKAVIRRMAREALDEDIEEIILTDPSTQHARNSYSHPLLGQVDETFQADYETLAPRDVETSAMRAWWAKARELGAEPESIGEGKEPRRIPGNWQKQYGEEFPGFFKKEYGLTPEYRDNAYQGRYSNMSGDRSEDGDMPGTVFRVNDMMRERASKAQSLYQRPPDWKALPKGASEFVGTKSAVRMFEKGDISTWIHELAHIALPDLDASERQIIEQEFGAGLELDKWKPAYHENFARAFERYLRDGEAPTPALQPVFARIAKWISAVWSEERTKVPALSEEVKTVFDNLLSSHDEAPSVFIPHRAGMPDLTGARTASGVPRTGDVIGDRTRSRIPLFKKNRLGLVRSGMVNDDPRLLIEHMNRVVMLARANQLRKAVVDISSPLQPGSTPDFDTQYVVKSFGSKTDSVTYDAMENADEPAEVAKTIEDTLNEHIGDAGRWDEWNAEGQQLYVVDKKTVDMMFKYATGKTPGATTKPASTAGKVTDATLDSVRALLLYANPGFYMANIIGNTMMGLISDPRSLRDLAWSIKQAGKASAREGASDPLWRRIAVEQGRGPTSGGLSSNRKNVLGYESGWQQIARHPVKAYKGKEPGALGRGAEATSGLYSSWGRKSGRIIDDTFRVAAWKQVARKHGYKTDKEITDLLDAAVEDGRGRYHKGDTAAIRDLDSIRSEAEQLMLDFDSMTPFEKSYLTRAIFLYPFLKASAKWPLQYAGQRPISAGILGQLALIGQDVANEQLGERPELPAWMDEYARIGGGMINAGSFAPQSAALNMLTSLTELDEEPVLGVSGPLDYLNPGVQWAIQVASGRDTFGKGKPRHKLLKEEAPLTSLQRQLLGIRDPSIMFADRSRLASLLRALRVVPTEINEREARTRARAEKKATSG